MNTLILYRNISSGHSRLLYHGGGGLATKLTTGGLTGRTPLEKRSITTHQKDHQVSEHEEKATLKQLATNVSPANPLAHFRKNVASTTYGRGHYGDDDIIPHGHTEKGTTLPHPIWPEDQLENVRIKHNKPEKLVDWLALIAVRALRISFDVTSGYAFGQRTEAKWIRRIVFLETVAGVPGMMGAMVRHLKSLRTMKRDHGWIHTLLEEAENERMHLMVALFLQQPGVLFRLGTVVTQGIFTNLFFLAYLCSSRFCHRFVGYLEEEAVKTYTKLVLDIDQGPMAKWKTDPAPDIAVKYWGLPKAATKRDMVLAIRADEAHHRLVNHALANIKPTDRNPFAPKDDASAP